MTSLATVALLHQCRGRGDPAAHVGTSRDSPQPAAAAAVNTTSSSCSLHTPGCNYRCKASLAFGSQRRRHPATLHSLVTLPFVIWHFLEVIVLSAAGARYSVLALVRVQIVTTAVVDSCQDEPPLATVSAAFCPALAGPKGSQVEQKSSSPMRTHCHNIGCSHLDIDALPAMARDVEVSANQHR